MLRREEKDWSLSIGPDTVRLFILKAKALSAALNEDYDDGAEHEVEFDGDIRDSHHHDGLAEEEARDLTESELRELISDLNVDETAELWDTVFVSGGRRGLDVELAPGDLVAATSAVVADIAR